MDKIEELARALCEADQLEEGERACAGACEYCKMKVHAVLTALLPPNEGMMLDGAAALYDHRASNEYSVVAAIFTAMIDAAIEGKG